MDVTEDRPSVPAAFLAGGALPPLVTHDQYDFIYGILTGIALTVLGFLAIAEPLNDSTAVRHTMPVHIVVGPSSSSR